MTGTYDNGRYTLTTKGVTRLSIFLPCGTFADLTLDGEDLGIVPGSRGSDAVREYEKKADGKWQKIDRDLRDLRKAPGLQGPIDDAFMDSFVMVSPTGKPFSDVSAKWVQKEMKHAVDHWRSQFRGDAPVKKDTDITDADIANNNLILWGDPGSNAVLAKIAAKLPVKWTGIRKDFGKPGGDTYPVFTLGEANYRGDTQVPVLIYPNPLNPKKYVVLNSGFTFREYDYLNNARQVPKLPDYAIVDITTPANSRYPGKIVRAGFFGEKWELLPNDGQ